MTDPVTEAWSGTITCYAIGTSLIILLYDCIITVDKEVLLVWPGALSLPKLLYYINRYVVVIILILANYHFAGFRQPLSNNFCRIAIAMEVPAHIITKTAGTILVCLRVQALYHNHRWVTRSMWILFGLFHAVRSVFSILIGIQLFQKDYYSPINNLCVPHQWDFKFSGIFIWAVPLVFDLFLVVLTSTKTYRSTTLLRAESGSPILYSLFRDGILYFIAIVVLRASTAVIWILSDPLLLNASPYIEWSLESTLISRFFLNLRFAFHDNLSSMRGQPMTAFALDNVSSRAFFGGLSRRRRRVDITTDISLDISERRALERVDGTNSDSEKWDVQPHVWYREMVELGATDIGLYHREANGALGGNSQ